MKNILKVISVVDSSSSSESEILTSDEETEIGKEKDKKIGKEKGKNFPAFGSDFVADDDEEIIIEIGEDDVPDIPVSSNWELPSRKQAKQKRLDSMKQFKKDRKKSISDSLRNLMNENYQIQSNLEESKSNSNEIPIDLMITDEELNSLKFFEMKNNDSTSSVSKLNSIYDVEDKASDNRNPFGLPIIINDKPKTANTQNSNSRSPIKFNYPIFDTTRRIPYTHNGPVRRKRTRRRTPYATPPSNRFMSSSPSPEMYRWNRNPTAPRLISSPLFSKVRQDQPNALTPTTPRIVSPPAQSNETEKPKGKWRITVKINDNRYIIPISPKENVSALKVEILRRASQDINFQHNFHLKHFQLIDGTIIGNNDKIEDVIDNDTTLLAEVTESQSSPTAELYRIKAQQPGDFEYCEGIDSALKNKDILDLGGLNLSINQLKSLLVITDQKLPESWNLSRNPAFGGSLNIGCSILEKIPIIRHLDLSYNAIVSDSKFLRTISHRFGYCIESLVLSGNKLYGNASIEELSNLLGYARLQLLEVSNCMISYFGIEHLFQHLSKQITPTAIKPLTCLRISKNYLRCDGLALLIEILLQGKFFNLKELDISDLSVLFEQDLRVLALSLKKMFTSLKKLSLFSFAKNYVSEEILLEISSQTNSLEFLDLSHCTLSTSAFNVLFESMKNKNWMRLNLSGIFRPGIITSEIIGSLYNCLSLAAVTNIDLSQCNLGFNSVIQILHCCSRNTTLRNLSLANNIQDHNTIDSDILIFKFETLTNLIYLDFSNNSLDDTLAVDLTSIWKQTHTNSVIHYTDKKGFILEGQSR